MAALETQKERERIAGKGVNENGQPLKHVTSAVNIDD